MDVKTDLSPDGLLVIAENYQGLVVRSATRVTAELIGAASQLKVVARAGTGLDSIDVPEATRRGILVMNTPGGNSVATAEHTVSLIMALHRHIALGGGLAQERKMGQEEVPGTGDGRENPGRNRPRPSRKHRVQAR